MSDLRQDLELLTPQEQIELLALLEEEFRTKTLGLNLSSLTFDQANREYDSALELGDRHTLRYLCRNDLFFLLTRVFKRPDANHPWLRERAMEVFREPDGHLDLWAREHYKSTLITFAKTIQDILINPEVTIGIFSHTRPIAKAFLEQIMRELQENEFLKNLFPDILYQDPRKNAPKWSVDGGIVVKRKSNPKESTIEAWGLVDGQPTSKHYDILVYDDVVTLKSVSTTDQVKKTTNAFQISTNLGAKGGRIRGIGTRYHLRDTYSHLIQSGILKVRSHPATRDGKFHGEPVFLSREQLDKKFQEQGSYNFSCFPAGSPVLMSDWTEKNIDEVKVGDEVVGYTFPDGLKTKLSPTKVIAINKRQAPIIEAVFESGRVIRCTPDHKWYTGRRGFDVGGTDTHRTYAPLGFDKSSIGSLISVYDPRIVNGEYNPREAGYLAAFFDGEGSVSGNTLHFHQSCGRNLPICNRLEQALNAMNFEYGMIQMNRNHGQEPIRNYYIRGGRQEHMRFLNQCAPAKGPQIVKMLFDIGTRNFGLKNKDRLISIISRGDDTVYNIQTETGNYICYGYATKNCQMLQNPVADKAMAFKEDDLRFYKNLGDTYGWNKYICVDPAGSKKSVDSDYTVILVIGLAPDNNYYLIDGVRDRMTLSERTKKLFEFHRKHQPNDVAYEQYGMQSDIEHIKEKMETENYRFNIVPVGGSMAKEDRIRKLEPVFSAHRLWIPNELWFLDYQNDRKNLVAEFIDDEYLTFPVCIHDDMLDCLARIVDPKLDAKFPMHLPEQPKRRYSGGSSASWMS